MNFAITTGTENGEFSIGYAASAFPLNGEQVMQAAHKVVERARKFSSVPRKNSQPSGESVVERVGKFLNVPGKTLHNFFISELEESDLPGFYAGESSIRFHVCDGGNLLRCDAKVKKSVKDPTFNIYRVSNIRASGSAWRTHPFRRIFNSEAESVVLVEWVHQEKDKRYELVFC